MTQTVKPYPHLAPQRNPYPLPRLRHGDHLTRQEFERRYTVMPNTHAELLNGVVHMASPVFLSHAKHHAQVMVWLGTYSALHPGVEVYDNVSLRLDDQTEVQPDAALVLAPALGGHTYTSDDQYLMGSPELIVEIAVSSIAYDLHDKRLVYQRCGVQEYLIWHIPEHRVLWLMLQDGVYSEQSPDADGLLHSRIFPGLVLDVPALLNGQLAQVLAAVQARVASVQTEKAHE